MIFFLEKLSTLSSSLVNKLKALGHKLRSTKANHIIASAKYSYFFSACNLCGSRNTSEPLICSACKTDLLAPLCISKCESCKLPLLGGTDQTHCPECRINPPQYDECHVVTTYEFPASNLVHRLKYQNKPFMARLIGQLLAQVRRRCDYPLPELICCVPIHPNKLREKKYNHAGEIARMTAKELALPFNSGLLAKTQQTEPQSKLSRAERLKNLENSFMVNPETNLKGMHVAVVDDVMTTGATLDLISGILKARGVSRVEVWAFARTPKPIPK
jgi:ComF family protein